MIDYCLSKHVRRYFIRSSTKSLPNFSICISCQNKIACFRVSKSPTHWEKITNKAFRHVETLFVQGNQVRTDQNKPFFLLIKKEVCLHQYELDYLGRLKFLHVEMPY